MKVAQQMVSMGFSKQRGSQLLDELLSICPYHDLATIRKTGSMSPLCNIKFLACIRNCANQNAKAD